MSQSTPTHEVHLDTENMPLDLTSPIRPRDVLFYDSGVWLVREEDRLFVPYRNVIMVRESDESPAEADETGEEVESESMAASEAPTDPVE